MPAADAQPPGAPLGDEPVGGRSRRSRVDEDPVRPDPEHRLTEKSPHNDPPRAVHVPDVTLHPGETKTVEVAVERGDCKERLELLISENFAGAGQPPVPAPPLLARRASEDFLLSSLARRAKRRVALDLPEGERE